MEPPPSFGRTPPMSAPEADSPTRRFSEQHAELTRLAGELLALLDTRTLADDPAAARSALATFSGKLRVHAAMEEEALYPQLLQSSDPEVAAKARELLAEVGTIYAEFFAFRDKWKASEDLRRAPEDFCRETMFLLRRLQRRMKREAQELYPLVERLTRMDP
jgi:hypothetical protein